MNVLIDLTDLQPGKMGGIEQYAQSLVEGLSEKAHRENFYSLLVRSEHLGYFGSLPDHLRYLSYDTSPLGKLLMKRGRLRRVWLQLNGVSDKKYHVLHFPFQSVRYRIPGVKTIVSIMDVQHEFFPEFFSAEELVARRTSYAFSMDVADKVITISDYSARSLQKYYHVPKRKIEVVYLSIPHAPIKGAVKHNKDKYLLYPAATWPHKNHLRLVKAFAKFQAQNPGFKLYLCGAQKQVQAELLDLIETLDLHKSVIHRGYVSDSEMDMLFKNANAVIYPTLFEGFGMPVLEALSHGVPVACSDISVLREVCDDAVLYFDPTSVDAIADGMTKIVHDTRTRTRIMRAAKRATDKYTSERLASETMQVYEQVIK